MMIYLVVFSISCLLFAIGEKKYKFCFVLGLILPTLLATMRADTVGVDVHVYVTPTYEHAKSANDISQFIMFNKSDLMTKDLEFGFIFISYLAANFFGGLWGLFFVYQLIMMLCIYYSIVEFSKLNLLHSESDCSIKIWHGMYVYYMLFYNVSLMMIRQSLACSLVLLGVILFVNKKNIKSIICIVLAISFHSTALIAIPMIAMYILLKEKGQIIQKIILFIGVIVFILGGQGYWIVLNILNNFITIPGRYMSYAYMFLQGNDINLAWVYMITISVITVYRLYQKYKTLINRYMLFLTFWSVFLFPLSIASANAGRIEYYFMYFLVLSIPMMTKAFKNVYCKDKRASVYMILLFGLIYWLGTIGLNDYTGTADYEFAFFQ